MDGLAAGCAVLWIGTGFASVPWWLDREPDLPTLLVLTAIVAGPLSTVAWLFSGLWRKP